ncbi:MAG: hypothetical protein EA349_01505 [Halomonadaceae bacterium]|nr:MAG: hypothetical protein EA349_01505 [Halomonadaceae bacterium]
MSQLTQLIEQARKARRLEDIFNIQPDPHQNRKTDADSDNLLRCLADLENSLFAQSPHSPHGVNDLLTELEAIANSL